MMAAAGGVLRRELGVLPPGDIRNCLAALSTEEPLLTRLFQYALRLGAASKGTASAICFSRPFQRSRAIWKQPSPPQVVCWPCKVRWCPPPTWMCSSGPNLKTANGSKAKATSATPPAPLFAWAAVLNDPPALPRALEAIANADLIVLGPGSLYTSLLPNLLVPELVGAIKRSKAPRLYICNLMTQPGETDGLDVRGHIRAIEAQLATPRH